MAISVDLLDVNVWLALTLVDHPYHRRARRYWFDESGREMAFCRITALAFLRLTTEPKVMAGHALSVAEAWLAYSAFRDLPEVVFLQEPPACEDGLRAWALGPGESRKLWTDAYLASFARTASLRMVSFDRDFTRMKDLDLLFLAAGQERR